MLLLEKVDGCLSFNFRDLSNWNELEIDNGRKLVDVIEEQLVMELIRW